MSPSPSASAWRMLDVVPTTPPRGQQILVVDDDPSINDLVSLWLGRAGLQPVVATDATSALEALETSLPAAVCLDLTLPDRHGLEVLKALLERAPGLPVVIMTADADPNTVVAAMRSGAYDYLTKPLDETRLRTTVERAIERHDLQARLTHLEAEAKGPVFPGLVGRSEAMLALFDQLERVAGRDITVLVQGESGTGKELVARALHHRSRRREGPLVAINCAAIPETLQESELFGHERGAFTGADKTRKGRFELADGGTLFLDEVAELSSGLQAKLLRVLQEKQFNRVGGTSALTSDFRLVAASHKSLAAEVEAGRFRADLYYRLAVFEVKVPPLRDRITDVRLLAERFVLELADADQAGLTFSDAAIAALEGHDWPGNVRELQNAIHRAVVLTRGPSIELEDLPPNLGTQTGEVVARNVPLPPGTADLPHNDEIMTLDEMERRAILAAIARTDGNLSEVVRQLGIGRTTLYRKLKKYGIPR